MMWLTLKTSQQSKHSWMPRISMPADGRPRKALAASKENFFRMFGTLMLRWLTSPLFPNRLITVNRPERGKPCGDWVWAAELWLLAKVRLLRALRMSHRLTFFTLRYCTCRPFVLGGGCLCLLFVFGSVFCMCSRHLFDLNCACIQMTDNA